MLFKPRYLPTPLNHNELRDAISKSKTSGNNTERLLGLMAENQVNNNADVQAPWWSDERWL